MESKYLIEAPKNNSVPPVRPDKDNSTLDIMEFFYDTIQGEGIHQGAPAMFLRLQGCTLDCSWCDTEWRRGRRFKISEVLKMMEDSGLISRLMRHHLVITGGSPLKQQDCLLSFFREFRLRYGFDPFVEVENECTLAPLESLCYFVNTWNNSPKLSSSGMKERVRYKPDIIKRMARLKNSYFKFVIEGKEDFTEIFDDYLEPGLIEDNQIILMPLGANMEELEKTNNMVAEMAIYYGVHFSTRLQIILNKP